MPHDVSPRSVTPDTRQLLAQIEKLLREAAQLRAALDAELKRAATGHVVRVALPVSTN